MNFTNVTLDLEFGIYNGSMSAILSSNQTIIAKLANIVDSIQHIECKIQLPNSITIELANKNEKYDTLLDNNKIVQDKYVKLSKLTLGNIPITDLHSICQYTHHGVSVADNYWGFNGSVKIEFDESEFILWHLKHNNKFSI